MPNALASSVIQFAEDHNISRSQTYVEIKEGRLRTMKVGRRRIISTEAAADWRRRIEELTKAAVA